MFVTLKIPVVNTDKSDNSYDYNGKLDENGDVDITELHLKYRQMKSDVDYDYTYSETKAFLWDGNKEDIKLHDILRISENGKMSLLVISINPETLESDATEELRSWMKESNMILKNTKISAKDRINILPRMTFEMIVDGNNQAFKLVNARMIEDYSNEKSNYYFAMLIGKIEIL